MALSAPRTRSWSPGRVSNRLLLFGLAAALVLGGAYFFIAGNPFTRNQQAVTFDTVPVRQGTLQVTVSATGPIVSPASVPLSFKNGGKLTAVDVTVGQQVTAGQALAELDTTDLQAAVDQAQATLAQQQANLAKVMAGATPQQAAAAQAQVDSAQTTLDGARKNLQTAQTTSATTVNGAQADIQTAQVGLASSQKALQGTQDQAQAALQADQTALANAQQAYQDQLKTFNANWGQVQAALDQQQVAVQNAQKAARRRQREPGRVAEIDRLQQYERRGERAERSGLAQQLPGQP